MASYYTEEPMENSAILGQKEPTSLSKILGYGAFVAALCVSALVYNENATNELALAPAFVARARSFAPSVLSQGRQVVRMEDMSLDAAAVDAPLSLDTLSSRVDRPIVIPTGVTFARKDGILTVKGPKGTLQRPIPDEVNLREENGIMLVTFVSPARNAKAMFGLYQALIKNMVIGVSQEFSKKMEMVGVGYRARVDGTNLVLAVGKSHDVIMPIPEGLKVAVEDNVKLTISGISNELVGQFCADIRKERPPEVYKGKGIRYAGEKILLKVGKGGKGKK